MNRAKLFVRNAFWVLISGIYLHYLGCNQASTPAANPQSNSNSATQESWNSTVVFSDSGLMRARLHGGRIQIFESRHETVLNEGIRIDFYSNLGNHTSVLTAERGRVDDVTQDMEAFENVVARSDSGTVVKTEYLFWDHKAKRIKSDRYVTIDSPQEHLSGYGFEADQDLRNYVIYKVSGRAELEHERERMK